MNKIVAVFLVLSGALFSSSTTQKVNLEITITNLRSPEGQVVVSLYTDKNQYTDNPKIYYNFPKKDVKDGRMTLTVKDIEPRKYVLSFLDDENMSNRMEYTWVGMPKEGFGFSNNQKASITGAPSYEKCIVDLKTDKKIEVEFEYW
jgi:uncharacterized protein (DUF2141 family)